MPEENEASVIDFLQEDFPEVEVDREVVYLGPIPKTSEDWAEYDRYARMDISLLEKDARTWFARLLGHRVEVFPDDSLYLNLCVATPNPISYNTWAMYGDALLVSEMEKKRIGNREYRRLVSKTLDTHFATAKMLGGLTDNTSVLAELPVQEGIHKGKTGILTVKNTNLQAATYSDRLRNFFC